MKQKIQLTKALDNLLIAQKIITKAIEGEGNLDNIWIAEGDILDALAQVRRFLKANNYKHTDILKIPRK